MSRPATHIIVVISISITTERSVSSAFCKCVRMLLSAFHLKFCHFIYLKINSNMHSNIVEMVENGC